VSEEDSSADEVVQDVVANEFFARVDAGAPGSDERAAAHYANACKPCIFDYHGVCRNGERYNHCHYEHSARQLRRAQPSRLKRNRVRSRLAQDSPRGHPPAQQSG